MFKSILRKGGFSLVLIIVLTGSLFIISSCGGGGGGSGGGGGGGISYNGLTTQASLSTANANKIFSAIWNGGPSSSGAASPAPALSKAASFENIRDSEGAALFRQLKNRLLSDFIDFAGQSKNVKRAIPISDTYYGSVSGTETMNGSIDENTLTGNITVVYTNYNDGDGYTYDGTVTFKVDGFDLTHGMITDGTMSFTLWTISSASSNISLAGSIRLQENLQNNSDTLTSNMDGRDNISTDTFRFQNFTATAVYNNILNPTSESETYSGRVYIGQYGYVDVNTNSPFVYSSYLQECPNGGGPIILSGAGNTKAAVTPVSTSYVKIEVDGNGDGVYETNNSYAWSNLAAAAVTLYPPLTGVVAVAGDGQVGIVWDPMMIVSGTYINGYNIYWSTTPGVTTMTGTKISVPSGAIVSAYNYTQTGLNNGTTYFYIVTVIMSDGFESSPSLEVSAIPHTGAAMAFTQDATNITDTTATLNGTLSNPVGYTTTVWFEYGNSSSYGNSTTPAAYAQTGTIAVTADVIGLTGMTQYHYRLVTQNTGGTFYGQDKTFRTYITPQVLASGLNGPSDLVVDASNVYWTGWYDGTASKTGISSGPVTTLATEGPFNYASGIAIDANNIYWTENGSGKIKSVPISGGTVTTIASGLDGPSMLKLQSGKLYCVTSGAIIKVDISNGATTTLVTGTTSYGIAGDIAVDSTSLYWTDIYGGAIKKVNINGGTEITLATGLYQPGPIAVDASSVYWAEPMLYSGIKKTGINGGTIAKLADTNFTRADLAVDSGYVYWIENSAADSTWSVKKVSINGGATTTLAHGGYSPAKAIAIDSSSIYWIVGGDINYYPPPGSINKIPKSY